MMKRKNNDPNGVEPAGQSGNKTPSDENPKRRRQPTEDNKTGRPEAQAETEDLLLTNTVTTTQENNEKKKKNTSTTSTARKNVKITKQEYRKQFIHQKIRSKNENKGSGNGGSNMCHQCQKNNKGKVVRCMKCERKRYCLPCMTRCVFLESTSSNAMIDNWKSISKRGVFLPCPCNKENMGWILIHPLMIVAAAKYPKMSEEAFAQACPVCRENCNCKGCLRLDVPLKDTNRLKLEFSDSEKFQYSKHILQALLPFLRQFNEEQTREMEIEAKIQGIFYWTFEFHG
ncbi:hypothetical protein LguiB_016985 [Lonicera macranthoides]